MSRKRETVALRVGRFFVDPTLSGYENAVGECLSCGASLTVNRATDLDDTYPSARKRFKCFSCGKVLQLGGDIANHPVDQIAYDAYRPLLRRQYMLAMLMVAQSLEWSLAMCAYHFVLGRLRKPKRVRPTSPFALVRAELGGAMDHLPLGGLRNAVVALAVSGPGPTSIREAREVIPILRRPKSADSRAAEVAMIDSAALKEAVEDLLLAKPFVTLRNDISHRGLRPTQEVAEHYYEQIPSLATKLLRSFGVMQGQLIMPPTGGGRRTQSN